VFHYTLQQSLTWLPKFKDRDVWERAVIFLSVLVYKVPGVDLKNSEWVLLRRTFPQIINSTMEMRDQLGILDPERPLLRYHISQLGIFLHAEGERRADSEL